MAHKRPRRMDPDLCTPPVREHRYSIPFEIRTAEVRKYLDWFERLEAPLAEKFRKDFGNLDDLLRVEIIPTALKTLTQFFNPEWKCFAFPSFFLGPTIEEFESIINFPTQGRSPYFFHGKLPDEELLGKVLGLKLGTGQAVLSMRNGTIGISERYLEGRLASLAQAGNWESFSSVLALSIFGLVLFPEKPGWISHRALDVFVNFKFRKENPTTAMLSDIYGGMFRLHTREERNKKLRCCLPLLYVWMIYRLFPKPCVFGSILDNFFAIHSRGLEGMDWPQLMRGSSHPHIRWQNGKPGYEKFIYRCGEFYNVPLVGTLGCYAYNPLLLKRQLGFDLIGQPDIGWFKSFELHFDEGYDFGKLERVSRAWKEIGWMRSTPGRSESRMDEAYALWVESQIFRIGLPFSGPNDWEVYERPKLTGIVEDSEKEASARLDAYLKKK